MNWFLQRQQFFTNTCYFLCMSSVVILSISLAILVVFQYRMFRKNYIHFSNNTFPISMDIRNLGNCCNWTRTRNHLVLKQTLNHLAKLTSLAKWLSVRLRTKWFWVRVQLQSLYIQVVCFAALWDTFLSTSPHTHSPPQKKKKN